MLLLFFLAILFLFLSTSTGYWVSTKVNKGQPEFLLFQSLLTGTAAITVYLNILSLFLPANWLLLIPLFIFSIIVVFKTSFLSNLRASLRTNTAVLFFNSNAVVTCSFVIVLILFALAAPYNTDSSGYHFLSILWNEKFKAVPGLANLFPQYGYNSSFFVISAAFSFTDVVGQSVYPINGVLIIAFYLWILKKSFQLNGVNKLLIWLFLVVCLRQFPGSMSSPGADALASILVFYVLFAVCFSMGEEDKTTWSPLILLAFFALIIKLSTLPLLLVVVLPFVSKSSIKKSVGSYLSLLPLVVLIVVPWLVRNIVLTGYLVFPFPAIDLFSVDWKVPLDIVITEKLHIAHAPRMISDNWSHVNSLTFSTWFPVWLKKVQSDNFINFMIVAVSLCSPALIVVLYFKRSLKKLSFFAWMIAYAGVWFWIITSPDIRFGYHYMLPCIFIPLLSLTQHVNVRFAARSFRYAIPVVIAFICCYYANMAVKKLAPYRLTDYLVYPLKSIEYFRNNDLATFKYVMLNNGVKLYIHDSAHLSINAPLPVCSPYRPGIKMRGNKLQDGFKTQP